MFVFVYFHTFIFLNVDEEKSSIPNVSPGVYLKKKRAKTTDAMKEVKLEQQFVNIVYHLLPKANVVIIHFIIGNPKPGYIVSLFLPPAMSGLDNDECKLHFKLEIVVDTFFIIQNKEWWVKKSFISKKYCFWYFVSVVNYPDQHEIWNKSTNIVKKYADKLADVLNTRMKGGKIYMHGFEEDLYKYGSGKEFKYAGFIVSVMVVLD